MRILITNNTLDARAGTELYVRDLALALNDKEHSIACYSPKLGAVAEELVKAGIEVVSDPCALTYTPDLIHAHHYIATAPALFAYPQTPAVFICHGFLPWPETPLIAFRQIRRYIAVDGASRERLMTDLGLEEGEIQIIQNGVDTHRFYPKSPLATNTARCQRALVFSNQVQDTSIGVLRTACENNDISLDVCGGAVNDPVSTPEAILGDYGLVFAKGRAAMEAMACGALVILADYGRWGGAVSASNFDALHVKNFGLRAITRELDVTAITDEIAKLNWSEGEVLAGLVKERATLEQMTTKLLALYEDVLAEDNLTTGAVDNEAASFFHALSPLLYERDAYATRLYEETKMRLGNEATSAALLVEAMVNLDNAGNTELARRLAQQVLFLQPGHPIAESMLKDT